MEGSELLRREGNEWYAEEESRCGGNGSPRSDMQCCSQQCCGGRPENGNRRVKWKRRLQRIGTGKLVEN